MDNRATANDPDRFFRHDAPGAHEWWYFDAISDDGRDVLVVVWYAGLPFDPAYGVAALRHVKDPSRHPAPRALDHSAIGLSWYRDGKTMAYALNGYRAEKFHHQADPFAIAVAQSRLERDGSGYRLGVSTPTVEGRATRLDLRFHPADATEPFERDLGSPGAPHHWCLAASDCRVEGSVAVGDSTLKFAGRGYHDHNAGAEEMSLAMRRWEWGRVHHGDRAEVYYTSEPRRGAKQSLWLTCRDGRPEIVREDVGFEGVGGPAWNVFGIRHHGLATISGSGESMQRGVAACLDDGPFYRRWLAPFDFDTDRDELDWGIAEVLDTRNLNSRWFNWMIPYRLKWPSA